MTVIGGRISVIEVATDDAINVFLQGHVPEADNLDSGFQPSGVGKMSSNQCVVGSRYRRLRM